jgi:hypothetical protein
VLGGFRERVLLDDHDPPAISREPASGERDDVRMVEVGDESERPLSAEISDQPWQGRQNAASLEIHDPHVGRDLGQPRALRGSEN